MAKVKKFLLCHPIGGVFLGQFQEKFLWSDLDPMGVSSALVFNSLPLMLSYVDQKLVKDQEFYYLSIDVDVNSNTVSVADCIKAGVYSWNPNFSPIGVLH